MSAAIEATDLGRRYGRIWALRGCTLSVPEGCVAALVGPNGAGKTTLLELGVGLLDASEGEVRILGASMRHQPAMMLAHVGFVAQDTPLYRNFSVLDMLRFGAHLNPRWDGSIARRRLERLDIPLKRHTAASCREASRRRLRWPSRWRSVRTCCFWTNRLPDSIRSHGASSSRR